MTQQPHVQPEPWSIDAEGPCAVQQNEVDRRRADLSRAHASLSDVMSEKEQRAFGLNLELLHDVLNERS